jgi:hypothetical protein
MILLSTYHEEIIRIVVVRHLFILIYSLSHFPTNHIVFHITQCELAVR